MRDTVISADLIELARLRGKIHLLLGLGFRYPAEDDFEALMTVANDLNEVIERASDFTFYPATIALLDELAGIGEADVFRIQETHVDIFQLAGERAPCAPYESAQMGGAGRLAGWIIADIEKFYAEAGLALSGRAGREPPDHVALELEFMSALCEMEAVARAEQMADEVERVLSSELAFLERHVCRWLPRLARQVESATSSDGFYGKLAVATRAWVAHERGFVGLIARERLFARELAAPVGDPR